jgi:hypothetical protein
VEKTVQVFGSFEEADRAEAAREASLTPEERIQIVLELRAQRHPNADSEEFARVYRIVELERS